MKMSAAIAALYLLNPQAAEKMEQKFVQLQKDSAKLVVVAEYALNACPELGYQPKQVAAYVADTMNETELTQENISQAQNSTEVQTLIGDENFCAVYAARNEYNFNRPVWDKKTPVKIEVDKVSPRKVTVEIQ